MKIGTFSNLSANPRPDALMKEQLVEMTGLSARVVRVWFQNKRCKEKKRLRDATKVRQQEGNYGLKYETDECARASAARVS